MLHANVYFAMCKHVCMTSVSPDCQNIEELVLGAIYEGREDLEDERRLKGCAPIQLADGANYRTAEKHSDSDLFKHSNRSKLLRLGFERLFSFI